MNLKLLKPTAYRNDKYRLWVNSLECAICAEPYPEAAHTGSHGVGTKASDFRCIPLCATHHRGPDGLDVIGPEQFEQRYNFDIREMVLKLIDAWLGMGNKL